MVILGGLEVLAAGYLIHQHNKNKREKARLDGEAAALTEQQYPILPPPRPSSAQPYTSSHHHHHHSGGRHSHDGKYSQSYDGGRRSHSHDRKHSHDRHRKDSNSRPPQYVTPPYASQANLAVPGQGPQGPQMGHHAPPSSSQQPIPQQQQQQQQQQQSQTPDPQGYYPPTGIPAHWEQWTRSRSPQPQHNTRDREIKYGFYDGQEHASSSRQDSPRGRSHTRAGGSGPSPYGVGNERSQESRVRFAEEDEILGDGPPPYRA